MSKQMNAEQENAEQEWYIGIDFGTSNTYIVAYEATQDECYTNASFAVTDTSDNIPTVITMNQVEVDKKDKTECVSEYIVGAKAYKYRALRKFSGLKTAARNLTPPNGAFGGDLRPREYPFEQCNIDTELQFGSDGVDVKSSVRDLLKEFFKQLLKNPYNKNLKINENTVKKVVIGMPVAHKYGGTLEQYDKNLKTILSECLGISENKVECVSEPELAGLTFLSGTGEIKDGENILVIDIGGGTTDFSVIKYEEGQMKAKNIGRCDIAGNAIDDLIYNLLPSGSRVKSDCRKWKEELFGKKEVTSEKCVFTPIRTDELDQADGGDYAIYYKKPASFTDDKKSIVLREKDGSSRFYDEKGQIKTIEGTKSLTGIFNRIGDKLTESLEAWKNQNKNESIDKIFFVGGTSIISPLREKLIECVNIFFEPDPNTPTFYENKSNVKDTFCDPQMTVQIDTEEALRVTIYNAVAIGACIRALDRKLSRIPEISLTLGVSEKGQKEHKYKCDEYKSELPNALITATEKGHPFSKLTYNSYAVQWLRKLIKDPQLLVIVRIGDETKRYILNDFDEKKAEKGITFIPQMMLYSNRAKVEIRAYNYYTTNATYKAIMKKTEIKLTEIYY